MRKIAVFLILTAVLFQGTQARAQSDFDGAVTPPRAIQFPVMSFNLDLHAPDGGFVYDLSPDQILLMEDGQPVMVDTLNRMEPGLELSIAINAGPGLVRRDGEGQSRYEGILQAVLNWAASAPLNPADRYNLVTNDQPAVSTSSLEELASAVSGYGSDFRDAIPGVAALSGALDRATIVPAVTLQERAILYITPLPEGASVAGLASLTERAAQTGVRVLIWLVAPQDSLESLGAQALQRLADQTRGSLFVFSGVEQPPDLETSLEPLRGLYEVQYTSAVRSSGAHTLDVRVALPEGELVLPQQSFSLNVLPPNPIFLSPPALITRTHPSDSENPLIELEPAAVQVPVLVDFPDNLPRPLTSLRLYVDGQPAGELTTPPYDEFSWDLSGYTTSEMHVLRLEVEDQLGLTRSSMETRVEVRVEIQPVSFWTRIRRSNLLPAAGAVLAAGASLGAVVWSSRRRSASPRPAGGANLANRRAASSTLTQPLPTRPAHPGWSEQLHWPRRQRETAPEASLLRLDDHNEPVTGSQLPLYGHEITFGRDLTQSTCPLEDPSADELHARLRISPEGEYLLTDCGSLAGTWVNFTPVSEEGTHLEHGDIVQMGRLRFRFSLRQPPVSRKPTIQVYDERI